MRRITPPLPPTNHPTITVRCCRDWEVVIGEKWMACGICGERPKFVEEA